MTTFAARLAEEQPEVIAIRDERVALRWAEVDETLNRFVSALLRFDLGPDKRMASLGTHLVVGPMYHTGPREIAYLDEDGFVYITDRFSDMVISGGVNIYPAEAELVMLEHPAILDVACIGVPHPEMGEELKALVILKSSGETASIPGHEEIVDWCRERLSHFKYPRSVTFVDDLGRNTMGKINKRKLRPPYWAGQESNF